LIFALGHALYMRGIYGGKAKNDRIDAHKIAALLRGGRIPQAYVHPAEMRTTRDLMRRRDHLVRTRSEPIAHIQNEAGRYNLPPLNIVSILAAKLARAVYCLQVGDRDRGGDEPTVVGGRGGPPLMVQRVTRQHGGKGDSGHRVQAKQTAGDESCCV
jgi:hypothetical protein